ncbi:MAG: N-acetylneuraminate synthase family protein [Sphingomonadales bacterium]|nr:N-acetylneuraminate synthase family protein [Sphingomonadales bacterium]
MAELTIAGCRVADDGPPLVIAEIGINHGGDLGTAKEMVLAAKAAGAEIVKFQSHVIEDEMCAAARDVIPGNADISIYEIMEACALTEDEERRLKDFVEEQGLIFLSTPFSRAAADRLEALGVAAYKIGSGECNNFPLVDHIAAFGKPVILSTGMNGLPEVAKSVSILRGRGVPFALLHCTNVYPTPPDLVRLGAMTELKEHFPDAVVGLSDHTTGNLACLGAAALGACILERHFTDDMARPGPDIVCSMDPLALKELIAGAALLQRMRGGAKGLTDEEVVTANFAFASVVTTRPVAAGERLTRDNIWVKRPGTGDFSADDYEGLLGRPVARDIPRDAMLRAGDIGEV